MKLSEYIRECHNKVKGLHVIGQEVYEEDQQFRGNYEELEIMDVIEKDSGALYKVRLCDTDTKSYFWKDIAWFAEYDLVHIFEPRTHKTMLNS